MGLGYAGEVEQGCSYSHTSTAHVVVTADEGTDILGEGAAVDIFGYLNHVQIGVGYAFAQALGEGQQQEDDIVFLTGVEAADHTEIHQGQAAIIGEEDVARVGITVDRKSTRLNSSHLVI